MTTMKKFSRSLRSLAIKSNFEKSLFKATFDDTLDKPKEKHLKIIIDAILNADPGADDPHIEIILHKSQTIRSWVSALKYLLMLHRCLLQIGQKFAMKLSEHKPERIFPLLKPSNSEDFRFHVHSALIENYWSFIQSYASMYKDIQIYLTRKNDILEEPWKRKCLCVQHFNMLIKKMLKMENILETYLQESESFKIIRHIVYLFLSESKTFYKYICMVIPSITGLIFELSPQDALYVYGLYSDSIQINKRIQHFIKLKNLIPEFSVESIQEYLKVDVEENKKIELFIQNINKPQVRKVPVNNNGDKPLMQKSQIEKNKLSAVPVNPALASAIRNEKKKIKEEGNHDNQNSENMAEDRKKDVSDEKKNEKNNEQSPKRDVVSVPRLKFSPSEDSPYLNSEKEELILKNSLSNNIDRRINNSSSRSNIMIITDREMASSPIAELTGSNSVRGKAPLNFLNYEQVFKRPSQVNRDNSPESSKQYFITGRHNSIGEAQLEKRDEKLKSAKQRGNFFGEGKDGKNGSFQKDVRNGSFLKDSKNGSFLNNNSKILKEKSEDEKALLNNWINDVDEEKIQF